MNTKDLIADLRSLINPEYAHVNGTESYERRICVEALEAQEAEIERLRVLATCECGDGFTEDDRGTCVNCSIDNVRMIDGT